MHVRAEWPKSTGQAYIELDTTFRVCTCFVKRTKPVLPKQLVNAICLSNTLTLRTQ